MFLLIISVLAAAHTYMFGRWLIHNGNKKGALVVYTIAAVSVMLSAYRYSSAP